MAENICVNMYLEGTVKSTVFRFAETKTVDEIIFYSKYQSKILHTQLFIDYRLYIIPPRLLIYLMVMTLSDFLRLCVTIVNYANSND